MKVASIIRFLAVLVGLVTFSGSPARAQSEVDPDHFDSPITEPFGKAKPNATSEAARIQYDGKFTLRHFVQCNSNGLAPGEYSVALRSDGKVGQAILNPRGRPIAIPGVVHKQANKHQANAILVEVAGRTRKLSAIQIAELDLVFDPATRLGSSSDSKPKRFERLPVIITVREKR